MLTLRATAAIAFGFAIAAQQAPPTPPPQATPSPQASPAPSPAPGSLEVAWHLALATAEEGREVPWLVPGTNRVFVTGAGKGATAHDAGDGHVVWTVDSASAVQPTTAGEQLVLVGANELRVLDQNTGRQVFRVEFSGDPILTFATTDRIGVAAAGRLQAWDRAGVTAWEAVFQGKPITQVAAAGSLLVFGTDEPALLAFDAASGAARWKIALPTRPAMLAATAERIYFGGDDRCLYSYRVTGEPKPVWCQERIGAIGQPIVLGKLVYFALLDNSIRAFDAGGGSQRWDQVVESRPLTGPLRMADSLGVALTNGRVVLLSPTTGKPLGPTSATATGAVRLLTAAASLDGSRIYTITIGKDYSRTLSAWARRQTSEVSR